MAEYDYIELWDSTSTSGGKYHVVRDGRQRVVFKRVTAKETFDGGIDVTQGGVHEAFRLIVRCKETETEEGFGDRDTLEYLYRLNNPNGSPSDVITFTDHEGNEYDCYMMGEFSENLLGVRITGTLSFYTVQILLRIIPS